jgi:hypothetical protein
MEVFRIYVLPAVLCLGAAVLLAVESRTLSLGLAGKSPHWARFIRRSLGALSIAAIGFMLHFGSSLPTAGVSEPELWRQFSYWVWVLGLVAFACLLAVWDVLASIRALKVHLDKVERDEFARLQEQIRKRPK